MSRFLRQDALNLLPAQRLREFGGVALIAILSAIAYLPAMDGRFIWDDEALVANNALVHASDGLYRIWLTSEAIDYWPLTNTSFWIEWRLWGNDTRGYHVTNLALHVVAAVLIWIVLRRLSIPGGFLAALLFAVHPVNVESVAWIAERKDVLSTFFWVLTVLAYVAYVRRPAMPRYFGMLVLYALALMSKPMVVTLPVVLLLLDIWPLRRDTPWARLVMEKVPLFALALATSIATVIIQHRVGAMAALDALPWHLRAANATIGYVAYLWKTIWPTHLAA
jgi:hypothetical protein